MDNTIEKPPIYNKDESLSSYIDKLQKFMLGSKKDGIRAVYKFCDKWMSCAGIHLKSLVDFNSIPIFNLPNNAKSKEIIDQYANECAEQLKIKYTFKTKSQIEVIGFLKRACKKIDYQLKTTKINNIDYYTIKMNQH